MAGRHTGWMHRKAGGEGTILPAHRAAARALLGQLQNRLALGGILSGIERTTLGDGTLIEARVDMGIPSVRITPTGGDRAAPRRFKTQLLVSLALDRYVTPAQPQVHVIDLAEYVVENDVEIRQVREINRFIETITVSRAHSALGFDNFGTGYRTQWAQRFRSVTGDYWAPGGVANDGGVGDLLHYDADHALIGAVPAPTQLDSFGNPMRDEVLRAWRRGPYAVTSHVPFDGIGVTDAATHTWLGYVTGATAVGGRSNIAFIHGRFMAIHPAGRWGFVPLEGWITAESYGSQGLAVVDLQARSVVSHFTVLPSYPASWIAGSNFGTQAVEVRMTPKGDAFYTLGWIATGTPSEPTRTKRLHRYRFEVQDGAPVCTLEWAVDAPNSLRIGDVDPRERYTAGYASEQVFVAGALRRHDHLASWPINPFNTPTPYGSTLQVPRGAPLQHDDLIAPDGRRVYGLSVRFSPTLGDQATYVVVGRPGTAETVDLIALPPIGTHQFVNAVAIRALPVMPEQRMPGGVIPNPYAMK